jgi:putative holliday junction resolvase
LTDQQHGLLIIPLQARALDIQPEGALPAQWTLQALYNRLQTGPFLAMDWGKSRVGLAISDAGLQVAMPLEVVSTGGRLRYRLVELWQEYAVRALVIGWPVHACGSPGPLCPGIVRLAERLSTDHGWPVALVDERMTTQGARVAMDVAALSCQGFSDACGPRRPSRSPRPAQGWTNHQDAAAASLILQTALQRWAHLGQQAWP